MHEQEVSNCISGLGRLGAEWSCLTPAIRRSLGSAFVSTIGEGDLPPRGLAMTVHGLGRMNADFTSLPSNFRSCIMSAIHKISPRVNCLEVSNILYGLGKMGTSFSVDEVKMGSDAAASAASNINSGTLSFAVPGLAMKGVSSEELDLSIAGRGASPLPLTGSPGRGFEVDSVVAVGMSRKARESILDALNREAYQMNAQSIANSLWGLMLMDAHWWILNPSLQLTVLRVVEREFPLMTEQELCNTVYALGRLGLRLSDLPLNVKRSLLRAVEVTSILMAPAGVVMTLLGLGRMHFMWGDMSPKLVLALSKAMERVLQAASERTLSGLVHALATVGAQWGDLSPALQLALLDGLSRREAVESPSAVVQPVPKTQHISTSPPTPTPVVTRTGRSAERASRTAFGASAILSITTVRNWASAPPVPKAPSNTVAPTWPQSSQVDQKSKSLSTSSLCNQRSSKAAAALLLSPSFLLAPTALVKIQEMISPPNLDMNSFKALIQSQLALPAVETTSAIPTPSYIQKRLPSQPVAANELEFYLAAALKPKIKMPQVKPVLTKVAPVNLKLNGELSKSNEKKKRKLESSLKSDIRAATPNKAMKPKFTSTPKTVNSQSASSAADTLLMPVSAIGSSSPTSGVAGNHLVYSLGQMGVSWAQLGSETRAALSDSLILSLPKMREMGVVNSLHGLTNLGATWKELRGDVQTAFQEALIRVSPDMGEQGVSVAILAIAKLEVSWLNDLEDSVKVALKRATARQAHIGEHALSSLLYGLGKLGRTWMGLYPDVRQTLKEAIVVCHLNDRCTPLGVANSLHGLAQMHARWGVLSSSVRLALFAEVNKAVPLATETQLCNIVGSLGKMGLQWEALPDQVKGRIISALSSKAETFNAWHLSTVLFSLGSMGLNWKSLPSTVQSAFVKALHRINAASFKIVNPDTSSKSYSAVAAILKGEKKTTSTSNLAVEYDELLPVIEYIVRKGKPEARSDRHSVSRGPKISMEREKELQMNAQSICMTIVGLSRLAVTYSQLSDPLVASLSLSLKGASPSMNCAQVAATISGLSKAHWRWDGLSTSLKNELIGAISRTASRATPLDMAILMNGLGTMGVRWIDLPEGAKAALQIGIKGTTLRGVADEVAGVTFGLGMMEVSWNELSFDMRKFVKNGILRVCGVKPVVDEFYPIASDAGTEPSAGSGITGAAHFAASSVTTSLPSNRRVNIAANGRGEEMDADSSWLMDPSENRGRANRVNAQSETIALTMSPQALANLMYAISLLVFEESEAVHEDLTPVHLALLDNISALGVGSSLYSEAEKEQILIYISTLQTLTPLNSFVTNRSKCTLRTDKPFTKPSKLQATVVSALTAALRQRNADFEVEDEYSAFSGAFPVDATIFEGNKPVAFVEVNGPQHYREDGKLRRKDLMKEALYRGKYPDASFTRVRFDQVRKLGSSYVGAQVAHFISNSPTVKVRCTAAANSNMCTSFFPLFAPSSSRDSCAVVYQDCDEDRLAARRAERELIQALSLEENEDIGAWSPSSNNIYSHAFYMSEAFR